MRVTSRAARVLLGAALLLGAFQHRAFAQDSLPPPVQPPPAAASPIGEPPSPWGSFFRSLLVPGWGQFSQSREIPGLFFLAAEGVTLGIALQANSDLRKITDKSDPEYERLVNKREDWLVFVGLNHLLSATEAFIAAHLWDFPGDLTLRPLPGGGTAAIIAVPLRLP